jgi:predicted DCC family thiol-disulfide oxidoreductase YuxK
VTVHFEAFDQPILLYDGTCGFCARSVQFVLERERPGSAATRLRFATLAGPFGDAIRTKFPAVASEDSVILFLPPDRQHPARVLLRSDAALEVAVSVGGPIAILARLARLAPKAIRDSAYNLIARHRHRIAGAQSCLVPTADQRSRFLDLT